MKNYFQSDFRTILYSAFLKKSLLSIVTDTFIAVPYL